MSSLLHSAVHCHGTSQVLNSLWHRLLDPLQQTSARDCRMSNAGNCVKHHDKSQLEGCAWRTTLACRARQMGGVPYAGTSGQALVWKWLDSARLTHFQEAQIRPPADT